MSTSEMPVQPKASSSSLVYWY